MSLALDEQKVHSVIVDPALNRIQNDVVPAIGAMISKALGDGISQAGAIVHGAMGDVATDIGTIATAIAGVEATVKGLDGWTLTVDPILIPAITLRLSKPKEQA